MHSFQHKANRHATGQHANGQTLHHHDHHIRDHGEMMNVNTNAGAGFVVTAPPPPSSAEADAHDDQRAKKPRGGIGLDTVGGPPVSIAPAAPAPVVPISGGGFIGGGAPHPPFHPSAPDVLTSGIVGDGYGGSCSEPKDCYGGGAADESGEEEKRRQDRNQREQARSQKISLQIKDLRSILSESGVAFKPTKFSILASVVEYIKRLQSHAMFLDAEHQKLILTITQTNEMIAADANAAMGNGGDTGGSGVTTTKTMAHPATVPSSAPPPPHGRRRPKIGSEADALFVKDMDYRSLFNQCCAALGVAALDGRFIDCNAEFETVSGYEKEELTTMSLFNLLSDTDMGGVFKVMGKMLKDTSNGGGNGGPGKSTEGYNTDDGKKATPSPSPAAVVEADAGTISSHRLTYWSGVVFTTQTQRRKPPPGPSVIPTGPDAPPVTSRVLMNITLTRGIDGKPKFFNCALIPS